MIDKFRAVPD